MTITQDSTVEEIKIRLAEVEQKIKDFGFDRLLEQEFESLKGLLAKVEDKIDGQATTADTSPAVEAEPGPAEGAPEAVAEAPAEPAPQ